MIIFFNGYMVLWCCFYLPFEQPNLNKFVLLIRPAWKEARATLRKLLSCTKTTCAFGGQCSSETETTRAFGGQCSSKTATEPTLRDNAITMALLQATARFFSSSRRSYWWLRSQPLWDLFCSSFQWPSSQ